MRQELRESQVAATGSANKEDVQVGHPADGVKNLQEAMDLMDNSKMYREFYVSFSFLSCDVFWN